VLGQFLQFALTPWRATGGVMGEETVQQLPAGRRWIVFERTEFERIERPRIGDAAGQGGRRKRQGDGPVPGLRHGFVGTEWLTRWYWPDSSTSSVPVLQQHQPPLERAQQAAIGCVERGDIVSAAAEGEAMIADRNEPDGVAAPHADTAMEAFGIVAGNAERGDDRFGPYADAFRPFRLAVSSSSTGMIVVCFPWRNDGPERGRLQRGRSPGFQDAVRCGSPKVMRWAM
jgi:hypothetical protein